jgi:hypothetical protein
LDPLAIKVPSSDGAWTHVIRFALTPTGLKAWSLTTTLAGHSKNDPPPAAVSGAGINSGVLRGISFPELRSELKQRADRRFQRLLEERDRSQADDLPILDNQIQQAQHESFRIHAPQGPREGKLRADDSQRAQRALDILDYKDHPSYRKELRALWSQREGRQLRVKTVDTRMGRLRDDGWLIGYGKLATTGPKLEKWLEADPTSQGFARQE